MRKITISLTLTLLLMISLQLIVGGWDIYPHPSHDDVMLLVMDDKNDAWDIFIKAYWFAGEVINEAIANGIPADKYEKKFNKQVGIPNIYRITIDLEIRTHAIGELASNYGLVNLLRENVDLLCEAFEENVIVPGNVNLDGVVDVTDQAMLGKAWDSKPGDPNWNTLADFNCDSKVDLKDLAMMGKHYGQPGLHANPIDIEMKPASRFSWIPD